jgi:two-component system response regulator PilR (NtrC family)
MAHILIIEDEIDLRNFIRDILQREGHQVYEAGQVSQALDHLATASIDLILLDLHLPGGINGDDLLFTLRDEGNQVPVIVVSGWVEDASLNHQPDCVYAVLKKPIKIDLFLDTVRQALIPA